MNRPLGQSKIISELDKIISLYKDQKISSAPSTIFIGPAGMGKSHFCNYYIESLGKKIIRIQGPQLKTKIDFFSVISQIESNTILFIDEIHSVSQMCQEMLFSIIDTGKVRLSVGGAIESDLIEFNFDEFTLVGATTNPEKLSPSLETRFDYNFILERYDEDSIFMIFSDNLPDIEITQDIKNKIYNLSKMNPRNTKKLSKRILHYLLEKNEIKLTKEVLDDYIQDNDLNYEGIDLIEIEYLKLLRNSPLSLSTLSKLMKYNSEYISVRIESHLIEKNLISIQTSGRHITEKGILFLKHWV